MSEAQATSGEGLAPERIRRARISVSVAFLLFGTAAGLWFVHIPVVAARLGLEPAILGLALLMGGLGSVLFQPVAGLLVARTGSKRAATFLAPPFLVAMFLPILSPNTAFLFVAMFLLGVMAGAYSIAINTQAAEIETAHGHPIMSSFHGFFSLGGLLAAGLGGAIIGFGLGDGRGAGLVCAVLLVVKLWVTTGCLPNMGPTVPARRRHHLALPAPVLVGIALLAFLGNTVEGAVNDWSALYLATVKQSGAAGAGIGYAMFSIAMALCRFAGGPLVERIGDRGVVIGGGVLVGIGMGIVVAAPWPLVSALGFLVIGIGTSNIAPVLISAASHVPGVNPTIGVATVSTSLAAGFLLGPPVIGFAAQAAGMSFALTLVGALGLIVALSATARTWHTRSAPA